MSRLSKSVTIHGPEPRLILLLAAWRAATATILRAEQVGSEYLLDIFRQVSPLRSSCQVVNDACAAQGGGRCSGIADVSLDELQALLSPMLRQIFQRTRG